MKWSQVFFITANLWIMLAFAISGVSGKAMEVYNAGWVMCILYALVVGISLLKEETNKEQDNG